MLHTKISEIINGENEWKEIVSHREHALVAVLGSDRESRQIQEFLKNNY